MNTTLEFDIVCKICKNELKYSEWNEHILVHNIENIHKSDDFQYFECSKIHCIFCNCDIKRSYYQKHVETNKHIRNKLDDINFNMEKQRLYDAKYIWGNSINYVFKYADNYFEKIQKKHNFDNYDDKINIYFALLVIAHKFIDDECYDNKVCIKYLRSDITVNFLYKVEIFCLKELDYNLYLK